MYSVMLERIAKMQSSKSNPLSGLEGAETVPHPVPPQKYTLTFLAVLVGCTLLCGLAVALGMPLF